MMPNFDTENEPKKCDFWSHFDSPGGRQEVRRASLRRRRLRHPGLFNLKRLTPAGVGGFRTPWKIVNRLKIESLGIDRRLDPPKITYGRGSEKNMNIE